MNLQQLETFRWVVRLGSFSQAARKLNTTQSTVSMRLAELERDLGIVLLDRTRRRLAITPKGRDLLRYAEEVGLLVAEIRHYVGNARTISGVLRIGASELVALTWLPRLMQSLKAEFPRLDVELQIGLSGPMTAALEGGELDVVFMPTDAHVSGGLRAKPLGCVEFDFVASPTLGLSGRCTPARVQGVPMIALGPTSVLHGVLERWFADGGARLSNLVVSTSMEVAASLARQGLGLTFLPLSYYDGVLGSNELVRLRSEPAIPPITFSAVYPAGRSLRLVETVSALAARHSSFSHAQGG